MYDFVIHGVVVFWMAQVCSTWCPLGEVFVRFHDHLECQLCKKCPKGYELSVMCNNVEPHVGPINMTCIPCTTGTYSANSYSSCAICSPPCGKNEFESEPCHATHNRRCKCKIGHARHVATSRCVPKKESYYILNKIPYIKMLEEFLARKKKE